MEDLFNNFEAEEIARAFEIKTIEFAISSGANKQEAEKKGEQEYLKKKQQKAIEFLKKVEERLAELSNQDVANLLLSLLAMGLNIDDDEELEYWLKKLELEGLTRIMQYFQTRNSSENKVDFVSKFTPKELREYEKISSAIEVAFYRKKEQYQNEGEFLEKQKALQKINKIINKDIKFQEKLIQRSKNSQKQNEDEPDWSAEMLKKLDENGVERGSKYHNEVMTGFNISKNKGEYVFKWECNTQKRDLDKIKELMGVKNNANQNEREIENKERQNQNQKTITQTKTNSNQRSGR